MTENHNGNGKGSRLTDKQRLFVNEYLVDLNATRAAQRAGYKAKNYNTLSVIGYENLHRPLIRGLINQRLDELAMPANEILFRLSQQARNEASQFLTSSGRIDFAALKAAGKEHLVQKIKDGKYGLEVEFPDVQDALVRLGEYRRLFRQNSINFNVDMSQLTIEQLERLANGDDPVNVLADPGQGPTGTM